MTISYKLGTAMPQEEIYRAARDIGFDIEQRFPGMPHMRLPVHESIPGLRLQVHEPNWFHDARGVRTEIEFDDKTDRLPYHPQAVDVLREMFVRIPDLVYRERYSPPKMSRIVSVGELLESI